MYKRSFEHWQQAIERRYDRILLEAYRISIPGKVRRMRAKSQINVLFILSELSVWKTEDLYLRMLRHPRFNPILGLTKSTENTLFINDLEAYVKQKGYNYLLLSQSNFPHPDIVFYQKPYDDVYPHWLTCRKHLNSLFCYASYGIHSLVEPWSMDTPLHKYAWQWYYENDLATTSAKKLMENKGKNIVVTGIPLMDQFILPKEEFSDPWKPQKDKKKRIIYAPHHTIGSDHLKGIGFSTFLENADFIAELSEKYKGTTQWAFKPHPLLWIKLMKVWGEERTNQYYRFWENQENTQISLGKYIDLFKYSDAMIHDCCSFSIEYLYAGNPVLYLLNDEQHTDSLNEFATEAFNLHEKAIRHEDIEHFVQNVIEGKDNNKKQRDAFYRKYLIPPYGNSACDNIISAILGK